MSGISSGNRDLIGYGEFPVHPRWPDDARLALNFVLNYEEGAESCLLNGDAASEGFLGELPDSPPLVGKRDRGQESIYEYGSRAGFWRLRRIFDERKLPITVYAVGLALALNPKAARAMRASGWEVASHHWRWIDYAGVAEEVEREHLQRCIDTHRELIGERPVGCYGSRVSENTRRLIVEEGGFLYDSDEYNDDLPFWNHEYGRPHLIIPYTLDTNDMRFASPAGFADGASFFTYIKDAFDLLYKEGAASPRMLTIGLHCRLSGRPGRAAALERFLDYVLSHERVWICRRDAIARHWYEHHSPAGT